MSGLYPVFLNLESKKCLVVGGGDVAARKILSLCAVGASVTVVAPKLSPAAREAAEKHNATWLEAVFAPPMLDGAALAVAATGDKQVNAQVGSEATARNIPVNVVDQPELCSFLVPSVVRRGDLAIAISTSGASPAVAKRVRKKLESEFGPEWVVYLELMRKARQMVIDLPGDQKQREETFNTLADSDLFELVKSKNMPAAWKRVEEIVRQ